ncbi:unnamed protein product [Rotaria magnacalcarata]|uniref:Uncharacterized protein n=1 Tax=Rotaria magnacalcarata TaxID=392030 RepID=A0A815PV49_9BILA|nr:unnamed protein product [Rotaria magnacalcarata]
MVYDVKELLRVNVYATRSLKEKTDRSRLPGLSKTAVYESFADKYKDGKGFVHDSFAAKLFSKTKAFTYPLKFGGGGGKAEEEEEEKKRAGGGGVKKPRVEAENEDVAEEERKNESPKKGSRGGGGGGGRPAGVVLFNYNEQMRRSGGGGGPKQYAND